MAYEDVFRSLKIKDALWIGGDFTVGGTFTFGDAAMDTLVLKGRVSTMTAAGAVIPLDATYTYGELWEIKARVTSWTGIGSSLTGYYFRTENYVSGTSKGMTTMALYAADYDFGIGQIGCLYADILLKGGSTAVTYANGYAGEFCVSPESGAGAITITNYLAALQLCPSVNGRITGGNLAKVHGIKMLIRDGDGGSTTLGDGINIVSDPGQSGTRTLTTGLNLAIGCTTGIKFTGAYTNVMDFSGATVGTSTAGSLVTTGSTWITHATAGQCAFKLLCANSAVTGDYVTLKIRARNDAASGTGINGTATAGNFSASAGINNYGNIFAVQGYAQSNAYTNTDASNIVCGLYSCIDATTTSSGRRWSTWIDDHSTTKAAGGHFLLRMSDNGATAKDGGITFYSGGRLPVLINFEDGEATAPISTASGTATISHKIAVTISGVGTVYIPLASGIA